MQLDYPLSPKARKSGLGWIDLCPAHQDQTPSLSIKVATDGKLLLHCFVGCTFEEIISAAGLTSQPAYRSMTKADLDLIKRQQQQEDARRLVYCRKLWQQGQAIEGTLSQAYLASRGIDHWSAHQRHHPSLLHVQSGQTLPALLTAVQLEGELVGLHRTYLNSDGTKRDKLMLGKCKGGAAHLIGSTGPLIVAEGIETTLSLPTLHNGDEARYWSALSAGGIKSLHLPKQPEQLILAADGDSIGLQAATDLGERAARCGWDVTLMQAPAGKDWNDVLMEQPYE